MKPRFKPRITVFAGFIGVAIFATCFFVREAVPEHRFEQITPGMTQAEVHDLLGAPHQVVNHPACTSYWYGGIQRGMWCSMEVSFQPDGRVASKFHDH